MVKKLHVRKDDTVVVVSGKDKGKQGKVLRALPKEGKVVVEGVNVVARHTKPKGQGDPGGIIRSEAPIYASKVMLVCEKCNKATVFPTRFFRTARRSAYARNARLNLAECHKEGK